MSASEIQSTATPLKIAVVGSGRVGPILAAAFRQVGHTIVGITARSEQAVDHVQALVPDVPIRTVADIAEGADLVLIAVSDDALAEVVASLQVRPGQLVAHTCGAHGLDVLEPAARRGALPMAIHPAMTFTGTSLDLPRLAGCAFAVTAPPAIAPLAHALVTELGGAPVAIANADRSAYHAALAHAANHSVTVISQARRVLESIGQVDPGATLRALVNAAVDGALRTGEGALTGPVLRGDAGTIAAHLAALAELGLPDVLATYRALALGTAMRCLDRGVLEERAAAALEEELSPRTEVCTTKAELVAALAVRPGRRAVVMTMGALHEGHLSLVRRAKELADVVVVTDFVNPLQFAPDEDFDTYPRDLEGDVTLLREAGVDVVFAPTEEEMYPREPLVRVDPGPVATRYEGEARPTHFAGVVQVVAKLLHLTQPDWAIFGQKDAQQLALIRTMVEDLDFPVQIVGVPIAREDDGVARSSRNAYLDETERARARALSEALEAAAAELRAAREAGGRATPASLEAAARDYLTQAPGVDPDYVVAVDAATFLPAEEEADEIVLALAARVGTTRLLDNRTFTLRQGA